MVHPFLFLEWLEHQLHLHIGNHVTYTWLVMAATDTYTVKAEIAGHEHGSIPVVVANAVPTALPSPIDVADPSVPSGCLKASFVSETVPDNTKFDKGEDFVKSWTVSNSGTYYIAPLELDP